MFKSSNNLDRAFNAVLWHEIRRLNTHLPKRRLALSELLKTADPTLETADGSPTLLKSSELQELAKIVPKEFQDRLKLPIIVLRRTELGKSVYTVSGERVEEFTVKRILGMTQEDYQHMYKERDPTFLYRPQVSELLRRFHSLIVIGFGIPRELADYGPSRD
jgi:uncharacterized protein (UPF0216 family)